MIAIKQLVASSLADQGGLKRSDIQNRICSLEIINNVLHEMKTAGDVEKQFTLNGSTWSLTDRGKEKYQMINSATDPNNPTNPGVLLADQDLVLLALDRHNPVDAAIAHLILQLRDQARQSQSRQSITSV